MLKINQFTSLIVIAFLLLVSANSCRKMPKSDETPTQPATRIPDYTTTIQTSISGFVHFQWGGSGNHLVGATVQFGNKTTTTDQFGYFEIKDATVIRDAAQLIVSKDNYETGYKTFQVADGQSIFTRVLLGSFTGGVFSASAGTTISLDGYRREIIITPSTLVNEATNTLYSDFVVRTASLKDHRNETFDENLPGGLLGLDSSGKLKLLTIHDFGNVVLKGINGEKLKLADGKTATVKLFLSAMGSTPLPASIHLWHYDPSKGFWVQTGNVAVQNAGEVSFQIRELGYFALASAADYVQVSGRLVDKVGKPIPFIGTFLVPEPTEQHRSVWYYSNEQGYFNGYVRENSQQLIQVNGTCTPPIYSKGFTAAQSAVKLEDVVITDQRVVSVKATLKSCDGSNVSNGYLQFVGGARHHPNNQGLIEFNTIVCNFTNPNLVFYVRELSTAQTSDMQVPAITPGTNDLGNVSVCGTHYAYQFNCKLVDNAGNPLPDLFVRLAPANDPANYSRAKSNAEGQVYTLILSNRNYQLTVYGSLQCNTPLFTTNFSSSNKDLSLGNLTISGALTATINGSVVDCSNNPITNGYVIVFKDEKGFLAPVNNSGNFTLTVPMCNSGASQTVAITAVNSVSLLPGATVSTSIVPGNNPISVNACYAPAATKEFVNYTIDNNLYHSYILPQDSILQQDGGYPYQIFIAAQRKTFYGLTALVGFSISTNGIMAGSDQYVEDLGFSEFNLSLSGPASAHITEYGPVGGYIAGTIQTNVTDQNFKTYAVRVSFRVKRNS